MPVNDIMNETVLLAMVHNGTITEEDIGGSVTRILTPMFEMVSWF